MPAELRVLDLLVALEQDLIDDLQLGNLHDQRGADLVDADIGEQAGSEEALHGLVDIGGGKRLAGTNGNVVANRVDASTRWLPRTSTLLTTAAEATETAASCTTAAPGTAKDADKATADAALRKFDAAFIGL